MKEMTSSNPRTMFTYPDANTGCHLKMKLATSVSTTRRAAAIGGEVSTAAFIDKADEGLGFFRRSWIGVT